LYILAEHWKSDLEFYKDDLRFLHHLIDEYFVWFAHREHLNEMRNLAGRLSKLVKNVIGYTRKISKHLSHLAELIDDPFKYDSHKFRNEHEKLEFEMAHLSKDFVN
jgi:hypothetical protein